MRSEQAMYDLILSVAKEDTRILGVLLNGSRADASRKKRWPTVVKGIVREDFFYTQAMYAQPLLESYLTLLKQVVLVGEDKDALAFGKANQFWSDYLQGHERLQTYFNMSTLADMKQSLLAMIDEVHHFQLTLSRENNQPMDHSEYQGALAYYQHYLT